MVVVTAPALANPLCMCGHPQLRHKGPGMCRDCGEFECDRFEAVEPEPVDLPVLERDLAELEAADPDVRAAAQRLDDTVHAIVASAPPAEAAPARPKRHLDAVKAERDKAIAETQEVAGELADERRMHDATRTERDQLGLLYEEAKQHRDEAQRESAALRARITNLADSLAATQEERDRLRAARDGYLQAGPWSDLLFQFPALICLTEGGCGLQFTATSGLADRAAATNHPCGPLTPVLITITHRTEGAPTA